MPFISKRLYVNQKRVLEDMRKHIEQDNLELKRWEDYSHLLLELLKERTQDLTTVTARLAMYEPVEGFDFKYGDDRKGVQGEKERSRPYDA